MHEFLTPPSPPLEARTSANTKPQMRRNNQVKVSRPANRVLHSVAVRIGVAYRVMETERELLGTL